MCSSVVSGVVERIRNQIHFPRKLRVFTPEFGNAPQGMNDRRVVSIESAGYGRRPVASELPGQIHGRLPRPREGPGAIFRGHGLNVDAEHQRRAFLNGSDGGAVHPITRQTSTEYLP